MKHPIRLLTTIANVLDGEDWDADTPDIIATLLRDAGYTIADADLAEPLGDPEARQMLYDYHGGQTTPEYAAASSGLVANPEHLLECLHITRDNLGPYSPTHDALLYDEVGDLLCYLRQTLRIAPRTPDGRYRMLPWAPDYEACKRVDDEGDLIAVEVIQWFLQLIEADLLRIEAPHRESLLKLIERAHEALEEAKLP